jgi:hypothetical protein
VRGEAGISDSGRKVEKIYAAAIRAPDNPLTADEKNVPLRSWNKATGPVFRFIVTFIGNVMAACLVRQVLKEQGHRRGR